MSGARDMPRPRLPDAPWRLDAPRLDGRAAALAAALGAGGATVVFKDRCMRVEHIAEPAEQALEMADRLAQPA